MSLRRLLPGSGHSVRGDHEEEEQEQEQEEQFEQPLLIAVWVFAGATVTPVLDVVAAGVERHRGAIRSAPSRRITSPLSIGLETT